MYMKLNVIFCDYNELIYKDYVEGAAYIDKSIKNNDQWIINMHVGPEYVEKYGVKPMSESQCRSEIESRGGYLKI